ncbi:hypothetical protein [Sphingomonas sp. 22176]|uniref:hypothetical protein n=1 Tax=Sphingomonas sp. 22176 TaxID=3453884 RepID=UPI003F865EE1
MAVYGFRGVGWFLCGVIVAPTCYMVTSHGAAERAKLRAMDSAIVQAHKDIRGLETEFDTRANMAQIERWNGDVLAMNAPQPQQYLASASGLAALDQQPAAAAPGSAKVETAALVIPTGQRPVETAPTAPPVATAAAVPVKTVAAKPVAMASAAPVKAAPVKSTVVRVAQADTKPAQDLDRLIRKIDKARLAQPDRPLLSAATISDLRRVAKREQTAQR